MLDETTPPAGASMLGHGRARARQLVRACPFASAIVLTPAAAHF